MPYDVSDAFNSMSLGSPMHMSLERSPMESMLPVAESYIRMCQDYDNRFHRHDNMSCVGLPAPSEEVGDSPPPVAPPRRRRKSAFLLHTA